MFNMVGFDFSFFFFFNTLTSEFNNLAWFRACINRTFEGVQESKSFQ